MSIHENEGDIDVVSSPEPSPQPSNESKYEYHKTSTQDRSSNRYDRSSISPSKTDSSSSDHGKINSNFTSFSINSILGRNEVKKDDTINTHHYLPISDPSNLAHDAAMISR